MSPLITSRGHDPCNCQLDILAGWFTDGEHFHGPRPGSDLLVPDRIIETVKRVNLSKSVTISEASRHVTQRLKSSTLFPM